MNLRSCSRLRPQTLASPKFSSVRHHTLQTLRCSKHRPTLHRRRLRPCLRRARPSEETQLRMVLETTDGQEQAQSEDLNIGAVAAIAVLVPLLICCLLCIMYFALRRKKSKEIYSATVMLMELAKSSIRSSRASRNSKSKLLEVTKGDDSKGQSQDLDASDDEADPEDVVPELPEPEPQPVAQSRLHRI